MRNLLSILAVCDVFVRSRFEKDFCQAGEANIQNYVPAPIIFLGFFERCLLSLLR